MSDSIRPASVRVRVHRWDGNKGASKARVMPVLAEATAASQVLRGENGGLWLEHTGVVRSLVDPGRLAPDETFGTEAPLKSEFGQTSDLRVIAFAGKTVIGFSGNKQPGRWLQ